MSKSGNPLREWEWGKVRDYNKYQYTWRELLQNALMGVGAGAMLSYLFYHNWFLCLVGGIVGLAVYPIYRNRVLIERQKWSLMVEFKDAMDSMVAALAAGYSMENAITEAYHDMMLLQGRETRMIQELYEIKKKLRLQHTLDELLLDLGRRSGVEDIVTFAQIYATARRSGGNLVQVMKRTADNIAEKMEMQREIQTMIAGKKMEAVCMTVIPLLIILYLQVCSPEFLAPLYGNVMGALFMSAALIIYIAGAIWSRHIMNIQC